MAQPRIVIDLRGLDKLWEGAGLFRYAVDLVHAMHTLAPPAHFVVFGSFKKPVPPLAEIFTGGDWRYMHVPLGHGVGAMYRDQLNGTYAIRRVRADLYHSLHTSVPLVSSCPVVVTIQDMMYELFPEYRAAVRSRPYKLFRWAARNSVTRIICPSQSTANDLTTLWLIPAGRIRLVYHGLRVFGDGIPENRWPTNEVLRLLHGAPIIVSPLNLEPRKNLGTLLHAFAQLVKRRPSARLVLFGKGGWTDDRQARYDESVRFFGLAESLVTPGILSDSDLRWLYRKADLFVWPTLYEGFGYPALEAMSAPTCVVVRGCSSMAEIVGDAGIQVEPLTPALLSDAMEQVLNDPTRRQRLIDAAARRARLFSAEVMALNTYNVYAEILGAPTAQPLNDGHLASSNL